MGGCGRGWRRRMKETERAPSEGERRDRKSTRRRKKERSKRDEGQRQQAGRRIRGRRSKWEPYGQAREAREHGWFTKQTVGERVTKAIGVEKFNCAYFRSDISQILRPFPRVYPFPFLTHLCFSSSFLSHYRSRFRSSSFILYPSLSLLVFRSHSRRKTNNIHV